MCHFLQKSQLRFLPELIFSWEVTGGKKQTNNNNKKKTHMLSLPSSPWEEKGCPQKHHLCQEYQGWAAALLYLPGWLGKAAAAALLPPRVPSVRPCSHHHHHGVSSEPRSPGRPPWLPAGCCRRGTERLQSGARSAAGKAKLWLAQPQPPAPRSEPASAGRNASEQGWHTAQLAAPAQEPSEPQPQQPVSRTQCSELEPGIQQGFGTCGSLGLPHPPPGCSHSCPHRYPAQGRSPGRLSQGCEAGRALALQAAANVIPGGFWLFSRLLAGFLHPRAGRDAPAPPHPLCSTHIMPSRVPLLPFPLQPCAPRPLLGGGALRRGR